jgi:hypothetical protein
VVAIVLQASRRETSAYKCKCETRIDARQEMSVDKYLYFRTAVAGATGKVHVEPKRNCMHQCARTCRISVRKPRIKDSWIQVKLLPLVETGKRCLKSLLFARVPLFKHWPWLHRFAYGDFGPTLNSGLRNDAVLQSGYPIFSTPVDARHLGCGAGLASSGSARIEIGKLATLVVQTPISILVSADLERIAELRFSAST